MGIERPSTQLGLQPEDGPFTSGETGEGYRKLFDALPVPAVVLDGRGFIRLANPQASEFLGLSTHAWLQRRSMLQLLPPDDRQRLMWRLSDRTGQEVYEMRGLRIQADLTTTIPCDLHLVHLGPPVTHEPMVLTVLVDRALESELRLSEERLRAQSRRLADAMWASQGGFWEWDIGRDVVTHDDRFSQVLGLPQLSNSPASTQAMSELIHPDDRRAVRQAILDTRSRQDPNFSIRMRMQHHGGGWVWLNTRGRVLDWDDDDQPLRVGGAIYDVSQEAEREEELRAAKEAAEASERLKSQWLANVGHEVRTPLNSVLGLVQLMQESATDDHQREYLKRIAESAEQLRHTLDDLLDNAKLEAGQVIIERLEIDTHELIQSVITVFGPEAQTAGLELTCEVRPDVPRRIIGDPLRLRQILHNLVSNALKFTARGSVQVTIDGRPNPLNDDLLLQVSVTDTGVGIDPAAHARLFTPFFQADASTTRRYGGTGLGLSICKRLAELMGGQIGVVSSPGQGSRFWFTARVALAERDRDESDRDPSARAGGARGHQGESGGLRIGWAAAAQPGPDERRESGNPALRLPEIQDLRRLLLLHDLRAVNHCETLQRVADPDSRKVLTQVLRLLRNFDFDAASAELEALLERQEP